MVAGAEAWFRGCRIELPNKRWPLAAMHILA
jgi:hypothetical protein